MDSVRSEASSLLPVVAVVGTFAAGSAMCWVVEMLTAAGVVCGAMLSVHLEAVLGVLTAYCVVVQSDVLVVVTFPVGIDVEQCLS